MPTDSDALFAFLVAALLSLLLVPLTRWLAVRVGAIDYPRERSLHQVPTPKLGGLAILAGAVVAMTLFLPWVSSTRALLGGALLIAAVGVADDLVELGAAPKLAGQVL